MIYFSDAIWQSIKTFVQKASVVQSLEQLEQITPSLAPAATLDESTLGRVMPPSLPAPLGPSGIIPPPPQPPPLGGPITTPLSDTLLQSDVNAIQAVCTPKPKYKMKVINWTKLSTKRVLGKKWVLVLLQSKA